MFIGMIFNICYYPFDLYCQHTIINLPLIYFCFSLVQVSDSLMEWIHRPMLPSSIKLGRWHFCCKRTIKFMGRLTNENFVLMADIPGERRESTEHLRTDIFMSMLNLCDKRTIFTTSVAHIYISLVHDLLYIIIYGSPKRTFTTTTIC